MNDPIVILVDGRDTFVDNHLGRCAMAEDTHCLADDGVYFVFLQNVVVVFVVLHVGSINGFPEGGVAEVWHSDLQLYYLISILIN